MSVLDRRPNDFAQRNLLLHALLGARVWGQRLERGCRHEGQEVLDPKDPTLLAALGVIAFSRRVDALVARARASNPRAEEPEPLHASLDGSLLR